MTKSVFTKRYDRFRELLMKSRKAAGLSQAEVAAKLKRPQTFVSKYERGERRLDVIEFLDVARMLGFDAAEFVQTLEGKSDRWPAFLPGLFSPKTFLQVLITTPITISNETVTAFSFAGDRSI